VLHGTDVRVAVRPSGTEPKVKCYLEVTAPVADLAALPAARVRAAKRLAGLRQEMRAVLQS
jgi:phosphomannomutase